MKGHKTKANLKKDIISALKSGFKISSLKENYNFSFIMLDVDPDEFIQDCLLNVAEQAVHNSIDNFQRKQPFSHNEMDYGSDLPQFKWNDLSKYEQSFATDSRK